MSRYFAEVLDHAWLMMEMHHKGHEGQDKRLRFQVKFDRSFSGSQLGSASSHVGYPPHLFFKPQSQPSRLVQATL